MNLKSRNIGFIDLETNGLKLHEITNVWCAGWAVDDGDVQLAKDEASVRTMFCALDECEYLVMHNGIQYDIPILFKLYGWKPGASILDTMLLSQVLHADVNGGHSLEAWGKRLGEEKMDYKAAFINWKRQQGPYDYRVGDEWVLPNEVMYTYCQQDIVVTRKLYHHLKGGLDGAEEKGVSWEKAIRMEHQFAQDFSAQAMRGVYINKPHVDSMLEHINSEMSRIERDVEPLLPPKSRNKTQANEATPPKRQYKADGTPTAFVYKWFDEVGYSSDGEAWEGLKFGQWHKLPTPADEDGNRLPLVDVVPMKLKDQQHLKELLLDQGWIPSWWNYKKKADKNGRPRIVKDDNGDPVPTWPKFREQGQLCPGLEKVGGTEYIGDVVKWVVYRHRKGIFQSLLDNLRPDGRVSAGGMSMGTPTARVTHKVVTNIPKASPDVLLGKECRSSFVAAPGCVLVGADAEGLEFRMMAHYMNDPEFTESVVNGVKEDKTDVHNVMLAATNGLVPSRDVQKNISYGMVYGAGDEKLGLTAGYTKGQAKRKGKAIRTSLMSNLPMLGSLIERVEKAASRGYIIAIDGRAIPIRSKHAALNTLLQSAGSICVKAASCHANQQIKKKGLRARQVIHYHDEVVYECHPDDKERVGVLFGEGLQWAALYYGVRCPLTSSPQYGGTWADIH